MVILLANLDIQSDYNDFQVITSFICFILVTLSLNLFYPGYILPAQKDVQFPEGTCPGWDIANIKDDDIQEDFEWSSCWLYNKQVLVPKITHQ